MDSVTDAEVTVVANPTVVHTVEPVTTVTSTAIAVKPPEATKTLRELDGMKFAQLCVTSGMFKDTADVAKAAMKIKFGYALGIDEATAMSSIIIVSGRMSFTANFVAARIRQSGKYRYTVIEKSDKQCKLQFHEKVEKWQDGKLIFEWEKPGPVEVFTMDMAKRAGLTKNETWTKYPEAMCFARCLTAGARTYCSDVFLGNAPYTPDELDPTLTVALDDNGEMVVGEQTKKTVANPKPVAKPVVAKVETAAEIIARIQATAKALNVDTAPFSKLYGVDDMKKLSMEQLVDFERKLNQRKASS